MAEGWSALLQPFIYHPPIAPEVPKQDTTATSLISHGTDTAVGAFLHAAALRQQGALETQRMAQEAALRMKAFDLEKRGQDKVYQAHKDALDQEIDPNSPLNKLRGAETDHYKKLTDNQDTYDTSVATMSSDFQNDYHNLGLDDAKILSNPALVAVALDKLQQMYPTAIPATGIPDRINSLKTANEKNTYTLSINGSSTAYTPSQVLEGLRADDTHDAFASALEKKFPGKFATSETGSYIDDKTGEPVTGWSAFKEHFGGGPALRKIPNQTVKALEDAASATGIVKPRYQPGLPKTKGAFNAGVSAGVIDAGVQNPPAGKMTVIGTGANPNATTTNVPVTKAGQLNPGASAPPAPGDAQFVQDTADVRRAMANSPSPDQVNWLQTQWKQWHPDAPFPE